MNPFCLEPSLSFYFLLGMLVIKLEALLNAGQRTLSLSHALSPYLNLANQVETGGLVDRDQPWLCSKSESSVGCVRPCLKK